MQVLHFPGPVSRLTVRRGPRGKDTPSDDDYIAFCMANPDARVERTSAGEMLIMPPAGMESDHRNVEVVVQLGQWAKQEGTGKVFGPSAQFFLPDGSALSPDAAWVSNKLLEQRPKSEPKKFPYLAPEFVVEVMSPSDRLRDAKAKMELWIHNGVQLGWLIDAETRTVHVYRKGRAIRTRRGAVDLKGDGPVDGFILQLESIWKGLEGR